MTVQNFCSMNARSVDEDFVGILITNPPRTISQVQRSFGLFRAPSRVRVHICIMVGLVVACSSIPAIVRNRSSHPRILRIHAGYIPGLILPCCRINQRSLRPNIRWSITFSPNSNLSARYGGPHCSTHGRVARISSGEVWPFPTIESLLRFLDSSHSTWEDVKYDPNVDPSSLSSPLTLRKFA